MVTELRVDPPYDADERTMLNSWLDWHRATVRVKCTGLDAAAREAPLPGSPLMSAAGLVSHLRWVESYWFEVVMLGRPARAPYTPDDPDADFRAGADAPIAELLADYERQCELSREIAVGLDLGEHGARPRGESRVTLRYVLVHMIEETARHNGHLDAIRELVDGTTGE
ncbi:DinB family protein [Allonocardiopsis opalescens]